MRTILIFGTLLFVGAIFAFTPAYHIFRGAVMEERAVRSERLFHGYGDDVFRLAQKIEWGDAITAGDITPVQERINERFGDDITFLFHALGSANISAIDTLIGAGADVKMIDKPSEGSTRDFVYFLGSPGGDLLDHDGINELIRIYLRHGGDPNYRMQDNYSSPLIDGVATVHNIEGVRILLEAGADPWAKSRNGYSAMTSLSNRERDFEFYDELIDQGYFENRSQEQVADFLGNFGTYAQRGDETSQEIQRIAMRVLKRNPHYIEESSSQATARIFKDHWKDPGPGVIPWDVINSDAVK